MPNETALHATSEQLRAKLTLISDPSFNIEVVSFEGHESTISPYNIKIVTYHDGKRKDMYNLINLSACFTIEYLGEKKVHHGIIKRVTSKAKGRFGTIFTFTLQPRFALLSDNRQYRIFHHQSVPEIIQAIFTANAHIIPPHGYELRLVEKKETHDSMALYEKLTYCVQYGESDAQFLLRIMSEWGLGFYFEQDTDANIERVIITNGYQHAQLSYPHQPQDVPYEYNAGGSFHRGAITRFSTRMSIYPEATQLNHYRDASPSWPLRKKTEQYHPLHTQRIRDKSTFADFHRHQEPEPREFPTLSIRNNRYRYTDLSEKALTYLTHTAQASQTTNSMTIEADTSHVGLNACMSFTVDGVDDKRIEAKTWLVTEVHFQGSVTAPHLPEDVEIETGEDYFCELRAVPLLSNTYRLPQQFPTPKAYPDTAIVVGDHNGEVQTDNHNRVKVQFTWSGLNDQHQEETSTYVRVSQLWAGDGFGAQFTPRVGDEVLVLFLGDSPNYPFIGGSLYNPKRLYPNKANQYLSGFVSQTPNRQGSNSILFNDTNGKEQIEISTTGNKIETIEKDHTVNVDGTQKVTIGQNQETTINESQHTHIKQNQETKVEGSQITKVTGDVKIISTEGSIELYSKKTSIIESDDSIYLNAKKKIVLRAGTGITLKVGGNHITLDPASLTTFPMMGMSGEVPPFASVAASPLMLKDNVTQSIEGNKIEEIEEEEEKQFTNEETDVTEKESQHLFWMENHSGESIDISFGVNDHFSAPLPQTADQPTLLPNAMGQGNNKLEVKINGECRTIVENIDPSLLSEPSDLRGALLIGKKKEWNEESKSNFESLSLIPNWAKQQGEVSSDIVSVLHAHSSPGMLAPSDIPYSVDDCSDENVNWLIEVMANNSLIQNSLSTLGNEFSTVTGLVIEHSYEYHYNKTRHFLKDFFYQGKFVIKNATGNVMTLVYKGNELSREFQAAIKYSLVNAKASYISSYANFSGAFKAFFDSMPLRGSNFIGFAISAAFDVNAFFELEDPEKNWGELLGALGVTFVKVWMAGFVGIIAVPVLIAGVALFTTFTLPAWFLVTVGLGVTIASGFYLDIKDEEFEIKESAKKLGREMIAMYNDYLEEKEQKAYEEAEKRALAGQVAQGVQKNMNIMFKR